MFGAAMKTIYEACCIDPEDLQAWGLLAEKVRIAEAKQNGAYEGAVSSDDEPTVH